MTTGRRVGGSAGASRGRGVFHLLVGRESVASAAITRPDGKVVVAGHASFGHVGAEAPTALEGARILMLRFK